MKPLFFVLLWVPVTFLVYGLYLSRYNIDALTFYTHSNKTSKFYDYAGITHTYSKDSVGTGSLSEIISSAQETDLDFIFITDVNSERSHSIEGYYGKTLVLDGASYNHLSSRFLYYPSSTKSIKKLKDSPLYLSQMLNQKSDHFFVLAHPFRKHYEWRKDLPHGVDGVEVINLKSFRDQYLKNNKFSFLASLVFYPFQPKLTFIRMLQNLEQNLKFWDSFNTQRPVVGFSGASANSRLKVTDNVSLKFPSYEWFFRISKNHLLLSSELTKNLKTDKEKILKALYSGQFYMSLDILGDPKGFEIYIEDSSKNIFPMGSQIQKENNKTYKLVVRLPKSLNVPYSVVIYRNGQRILKESKTHLEYNLKESGVYRAVVFIKLKLPFPLPSKRVGWIYTNPFYFDLSLE